MNFVYMTNDMISGMLLIDVDTRLYSLVNELRCYTREGNTKVSGKTRLMLWTTDARCGIAFVRLTLSRGSNPQ